MKNEIKIFNDKQVRTVWDDEKDEWFFSVVDVVGILTESPNPRNYWKVLKHRLSDEGSQLVTSCNQLKLPGAASLLKNIKILKVLKKKTFEII